MYILCLIGLWTRSPKTEVEKLRIERLKMFLNIFAGFVNLRKSLYIHWSAGRSPRVHEVNPGRDPSTWYQSQGFENVIKI